MNDATSALRLEFIEAIGLRLQAFGLLRASGRILGLLVFDGTDMSAPGLATALGISKGSVNTGLQELQSRSVIRKVSHRADRTTYYQLLPDPYADLLRQAAQQSRTSACVVNDTHNQIAAQEVERRQRLSQFSAFYAEIATALEAAGLRLDDR
ncbi:DNA-binding transcriptional regulator GbsR, MarR family [Loktanella atrilutea]|uniref:DNA-binding transcriptional regulator GbsR, MarR family n=1 Tax=Loktanella atrilutea TaxID=366533 RepID=A0A1M5E9P4_LOKAT|nr:MarR family transcriptional regulator [Loktanella atrilutea]SHF75949.1 DNA-binding transcriptional regulator GbsR, MarR family [Loktanella atrilutea]